MTIINNLKLDTTFRQLILCLFIASFGLSLLITKVLSSQHARFYCAVRDNYPHTLVNVSGNEYAVIRWRRLYRRSSTASTRNVTIRCQQVAENFQNAYDSGSLYYVTSGHRNMRSIICASDRKRGDCIHTLIDLSPNENPNEVIRRLFDMTTLSPRERLDQNRRLYIDIQNVFSESNIINNLGE